MPEATHSDVRRRPGTDAAKGAEGCLRVLARGTSQGFEIHTALGDRRRDAVQRRASRARQANPPQAFRPCGGHFVSGWKRDVGTDFQVARAGERETVYQGRRRANTHLLAEDSANGALEGIEKLRHPHPRPSTDEPAEEPVAADVRRKRFDVGIEVEHPLRYSAEGRS